MDEADYAAANEETYRRAALARKRPMDRIASGDGVCRDCGDPIEEDRLAAVPETGLCRHCADEREAERVRLLRRGP